MKFRNHQVDNERKWKKNRKKIEKYSQKPLELSTNVIDVARGSPQTYKVN